MDKQEKGQTGEQLAVDYLASQGLDILETNWRFGKNEVDIIAANNSEIIFVEVKTRSSDFYGSPESFINKSKQRIIIKAAQIYTTRFNIDKEVRFDVVSVLLNSRQKDVKHFEYAFMPQW